MKLIKFLIAIPLFTYGAISNAGYGTGFFVSTNGFILTNAHVISGASKIEVTSKNGKTFDAKVVQTDDANDLALIKIESLSSPLKLTTSLDVEKGEKVYTLGFPSPQLQGYEPKYTEGVVSSFSGIVGVPNTYQITTPIQPGNSGGPLVNNRGEFVGIIVSKLNSENVQASYDFRPEGVSYAVKSDYALSLIRLIDEAKRAPKSTPVKSVAQVEDSVVLIRTTLIKKEQAVEARSTPVPQPRQPINHGRKISVTAIAPDIAENGCVVPIGFNFSPPLPANTSVEIFASENLIAIVKSTKSEILEFQFRTRMTRSGSVTLKCEGCTTQAKQVDVRLSCSGDSSVSGRGNARIRVSDQYFRTLLEGNLPNSVFLITDENNEVEINTTQYSVVNPFVGIKTLAGFSSRTCISVAAPNGQLNRTTCGN
jgi:V8-like Glu-specific endopeptidase